MEEGMPTMVGPCEVVVARCPLLSVLLESFLVSCQGIIFQLERGRSVIQRLECLFESGLKRFCFLERRLKVHPVFGSISKFAL